MKWLIIGSVATKHWFEDARDPLDIDLLTPAKISGNHSKLCVVDAQWHDQAEYIMSINKDKVFADPDILFTLKVSHAHWKIKFQKTLFDINFLQSKGCFLNFELYERLVKVWEGVHGQKQVNLNQDLPEFFSDAVHRVHDHEELHQAVSVYDRPMHEKIRPDLGRAWCSEEMFNALSYTDQIICALEEIMVTAIERRKLTPASRQSELLSAMSYAHEQLCTSMTKGWFARYLILNHHYLLHVHRQKWLPHLIKSIQGLPWTTTS